MVNAESDQAPNPPIIYRKYRRERNVLNNTMGSRSAFQAMRNFIGQNVLFKFNKTNLKSILKNPKNVEGTYRENKT